MVVNYTEEGWLIITQRSHGLLASQICAFWKKDNQPDRWIETLIATAEHDDANNELEKSDLLEENGGPKNFKMVPFQKDYCDGLMNNAMTKGRYIALLIARHIQFLYGEIPEAKSYCRSLQKQEKLWLKETKATRSEIDKSYRLLEFCDAFSLLICQNLIPAENRKIEISIGPDGKPYELFTGDDKQLIVSPWPFELETFKVNYETRVLGQLSFKDVTEFRKVFLAAPVNLCEVIVSRK